jgi:hypothetical protein
MSFVSFMSSSTGRGLRILAGAGLIAGRIVAGGIGGVILAVIGIVPLAAGVLNVCLFAPLFGLNLNGHRRAAR